MLLPQVGEPGRYQGLYVFDFGDWSALGYTADEIGVLLESEEFSGGKVYRIHRASPDGTMELRGVTAERLQAESGMFFYRGDLEHGRADFAQLIELANRSPAPCRAKVYLADRYADCERQRYVTALVYPAEFEDDIASWLLAARYAGGDTVEGGISHVADFNQEQHDLLEREQLWSESAIPSRSADEVLASVRVAVQR